MIPKYRIDELDELLDDLTSGKIIHDYQCCREYRAIYDIDTDLVDSIAELQNVDPDEDEWEDARDLLEQTIHLRDRYKSYL